MLRSLVTGFGLMALVALGGAAPSVRRPGSFSVDLVAKAKKASHPVQTLLQPWHKFPSAVMNANQTKLQKQYGSVVADPVDGDEEYVVPITIGDQLFTVDFDTGSSDLWVFSEFLTHPSQDQGQTEYTPGSTAHLLPNYTWSIGYGDGSSSSGIVYSDTVIVGPVTATGQAVEAATAVSAQFSGNTASDGLLGLAFSTLNTVKPVQQKTFFDTVKPTLKQKVFAADIKHDAPGSYDFGFIDQSKYTGNLIYTPVIQEKFWEIDVGKVSVGNGGFVDAEIGTAVVDTGTTLLYLPTDVVFAYYAEVPSVFDLLGSYLVACNATLPDFNVQIADTTFSVPGSVLVYSPLEAGLCIGGIQSSAFLGINIFGDMFIKNFYTVFDEQQQSPRVGFANRP